MEDIKLPAAYGGTPEDVENEPERNWSVSSIVAPALLSIAVIVGLMFFKDKLESVVKRIIARNR